MLNLWRIVVFVLLMPVKAKIYKIISEYINCPKLLSRPECNAMTGSGLLLFFFLLCCYYNPINHRCMNDEVLEGMPGREIKQALKQEM